jgi:hypothetical protein
MNHGGEGFGITCFDAVDTSGADVRYKVANVGG